MFKSSFKLNVNTLQSREEVLKWCLEMNSGGTPHPQEELDRVRDLLENEGNKFEVNSSRSFR